MSSDDRTSSRNSFILFVVAFQTVWLESMEQVQPLNVSWSGERSAVTVFIYTGLQSLPLFNVFKNKEESAHVEQK